MAADYDALLREPAAPPWEIGGPQPALARILAEGVPGRTALDAGCGTGELALALARRHRHGGTEADDYRARLPALVAPGGTVFVLAVSQAAGHGWGITEEYLRTAFAAPDWADPDIAEIDVVAHPGAEELLLPGFLLRAVRAAPPVTG